MATHSNIPAWRIPWTEEPGRLHRVHGVAVSDTAEVMQHTHTVRAGDRTWVKDWCWLVTPTTLPLVGKKQVKRVKEGIVSYGTMWPPPAPGQASARVRQTFISVCRLNDCG